MINRHHLALLLCCCLLGHSRAQLATLAWDIQQDRPVPHELTIWQGESLHLRPRLVQGTQPLSITNTVTFRYREPTLAPGLYRHIPATPAPDGTITITWLPAYDSGAMSYDYQIIIGHDPSNPRAHGRITMRPTIGWLSPGTAPPPIHNYLTQSDLSTALAPYGPRLDLLEAKTNAWDSAHSYGPHAGLYLNLPDWQSWLDTNTLASTTYVDQAISAIPPPLTDRIANETQMLDADLDIWDVREVTDTNVLELTYGYNYASGAPPVPVGTRYTLGTTQTGGVVVPAYVSSDPDYQAIYLHGSDWYFDLPGSTTHELTQMAPGSGGDLLQWERGGFMLYNGVLPATLKFDFIRRDPVRIDTVARASELASATNALVETYFLGTNAYLIVSNDTLRIQREDAGTNLLLWSSTGSASPGIDPVATQQLWQAIGQLQNALAAVDPAWGKRAPDGSLNPDPDYMTYLNAPATMHASGYQWASSGAYYVLAQSGAVAFDGGPNGEARWGLDLSSNYVGFVRGGSIVVGAQADGIIVDSQAQTASITFDYGGGDWPVLMFAPSLSDGLAGFVEQDGVAWVDNADGTATVTAPATTPGGFWYATTTYSTDAIFVTKPPLRLDGGIYGSTNSIPIHYDSTISITVEGKTYRLPAERSD